MKGPRILASRFVSLVIGACLLGGLTFAVLATAQSPSPDNRPHLLLVPDTAEGAAALAASDVRVIARYESFALVEARGRDEERLRRAGAERRDDMRTVETAAGEVDPSRDRSSLAAKEGPDRDEVLALVQFVGPPKDAWVDRLRRTGVRVLTYQAQNSYVVHASGDAVDRLTALLGTDPVVRAVSVLTAADKVERVAEASGRWAVTTVAGPAGADARDEAVQAGPVVGAPATVGALRTQYLALSAAEVDDLARDPSVVAIEPDRQPELMDERAAQIVAGNLTAPALTQPAGPGYLGWLVHPDRIPNQTTFGFAIDVTDTGLDNGANPPAHADFREQGSGANPDRLAYATDYTTETDARDCGGHGTNTASIATGYNTTAGGQFEDGEGYNHGLGVAPFAQLGASKIFPSCGGSFVAPDYQGVAAAAYSNGARISNNSWGTNGLASWGTYTSRARLYDQIVRDASTDPLNQELVEVFAAGNDGEGIPGPSNEGYGTISAEGSAKNVITVGAAESVRASGTDGCGTTNAGADSARDIIDFSSRGPTDDGRLKPDLVAPGTHVTGASAQHGGYTGADTCNPAFAGSPFYSLLSGSSQAAPQVSGAAALVRHWYDRTQGAAPSPALTKALLINTATDLAGGNNGKGDSIAGGPNTDQGWGRVNVGAVFDSTARAYRDQLTGDTLTGAGQASLHTYRVLDENKPVKATLAWTDAPGPPTGVALVNDLDLAVDAAGDNYKGNVFAGSFSRTGGSADTRDNVESVFLPAGTNGRFAVTVEGTAIGGDGVPGNGDTTDQDFALVVSNAVEEDAPVLVHESTDLDDSVLGDNDGVVESDEEFELTEGIRNAGTDPASGLNATLTANGLDITIGTSAYPDLAASATESNATPFEAHLPNAAACGVDVPAELEIDSTVPDESYTIPLVLPTGELGAPFVADSGDIPKSIPDDSAAGVTSTVFVSDAGRIKDVDVTIGELRHGWLGDLVIDLVAPDGTTVRLVEHPGGPDNGAKDLVDVTFDDAAPGTIPAGVTPVTGSFRPQNDQLSRLNGKQRQGTWTLRVRDLFEGDTGTLEAWGTTSRKAVCDIDTVAPDTAFGSGPANPSNSRDASFTFSSPDDSGATFECRLDGGAWIPCAAPKSYSGLADGAHGFQVRAVDGSGNRDTSPPPAHTWTIDATAPDTAIASGPPAYTSSGDPTFVLSASEPGVTFRCQLDQGAPVSCSSTQSYSGIGEGQHTFRVSAVDALGNEDPSPAAHTWTVDRTAPVLSVSGLAGPTTDRTPTLRGTAGVAAGDGGTVMVKLFSGTLAAGLPAQTIVVPRDEASGAWAAEPAALAEGTWTVQAEQADAAGNVGTSAPSTFRVSIPPTFVVAPAEERLGDVLAGRYTVLAACASACKATAKLTVSGAAARRLGFTTKRSMSLGSGVKRLASAGTAAVRVRLTSRARAALSRRALARATLRVTVSGGEKVALKRTVALRRSAGLARVARRGLPMWAACSTLYPLRGRLTVSSREARRLGLKRNGTKRVEVAAGRITSGPSATRMTLKVKQSARKALRRAARMQAQFEAVAGTPPDPTRTAKRTLTLRR